VNPERKTVFSLGAFWLGLLATCFEIAVPNVSLATDLNGDSRRPQHVSIEIDLSDQDQGTVNRQFIAKTHLDGAAVPSELGWRLNLESKNESFKGEGNLETLMMLYSGPLVLDVDACRRPISIINWNDIYQSKFFGGSNRNRAAMGFDNSEYAAEVFLQPLRFLSRAQNIDLQNEINKKNNVTRNEGKFRSVDEFRVVSVDVNRDEAIVKWSESFNSDDMRAAIMDRVAAFSRATNKEFDVEKVAKNLSKFDIGRQYYCDYIVGIRSKLIKSAECVENLDVADDQGNQDHRKTTYKIIQSAVD